MNKASWGLSIVLLSALGTSILFIHKEVALKSVASTRDIDSFMIDADYTQYDEDGNVHVRLISPYMAHYRTNDRAFFRQPSLSGYTAERVPWQVTADHGKTLKGVNQVYFWDNVVLKQLSYPNHPDTTLIKTSTLMVYPKRSYAETDQAVTITRPNSVAEGVGMQTDFKSGIMKLLSHATGDYVPPQNQS